MVRITKTPADQSPVEQPPSPDRKIVVRKPSPSKEEEVVTIPKKETSPQAENVPPAERRLVEIRNDTGEDYMRLSQADHVYLVQDTYLGSDQQTERETWVLDLNSETLTSIQTVVTIPQAVERIFLEALSNAGDNALRSMKEKIDPGLIAVTMDKHRIKVRNGGKTIPIKINKKEGMWNPELIFGVMLTSSNYSTEKKRVGCGRNGIGIKATNIMSKFFSVEVGDPANNKHYYQEWHNNMKEKDDPIIEDGYDGEPFVEITYMMDFERFGYSSEEGYPEEAFGLYARYVYDYSQNIHVHTSFNGMLFEPADDPKDHGRFYFGDTNMVVHYEWPEGTEIITKKNGRQISKDPTVLPTSILVLADTPNKGKCVSFVNGILTLEGGVHVNEALKAVTKPLLEQINASTITSGKGKGKGKEETKAKDTKRLTLTWKDVKNHLSLLLVCHLEDPAFGGQMKEKLTKPTPKFTIPPKVLSPIANWKLVHYLLAMMEDKVGKLLASTDGKKKRYISIDKGRDANEAGGPRSADCMLFVVEGDSAKQYAYVAQGLIEGGPDYIGVAVLKGKPLNVMNANPLTITKNKEISELKKILGIHEFTDYTDPRNFNKLRYGKLVILADADDDGKHIMGLVLLIFHCYYPSLLQVGYVSFLRTPIIRIFGHENLSFYTDAEYRLWREDNPNYNGPSPKYYKGLATSKEEDVKIDMQNPHYVKCIYNDQGENQVAASEKLDLVFNNKRADDRKVWLRDWNLDLEDLDIGRLEEISIADFVDKELIVYAKTSIRRSIPSLFDGLKDGQRKVLYGAYLLWGKPKSKDNNVEINKNAKSKKVYSFASYVADNLMYHHGPGSLEKTITGMGQNFVGSNNMNYLYPDGMFGSREEGGKDAGSSRYIETRLEWWFPFVFVRDDMPLLTLMEEEGNTIEPQFMLPILPMHIINGAHGIGTGWSSHIPNHNPLDVVGYYRAKLTGQPLPSVKPWYRGFKGEISIKITSKKKVEELSNYLDRQEEKRKEEEEEDGNNDYFPEEEEGTSAPRLSVVTRGTFTHRDGSVVVSELPVGLWTETYRQWLQELIEKKTITGFTWHGDNNTVLFKIQGFRDANLTSLHLQRSYGMTNMVLLDENDRPIKYSSITAILEAFYRHRLPYFAERKKIRLQKYEDDINKLDAKARFIEAFKAKKINLDASNEEIDTVLAQLNIPTWVRDIKTRSLAKQDTEKLYREMGELRNEMDEYTKKRPEDLWLEDLDRFEEAWVKNEVKNETRRTVKVTKKGTRTRSVRKQQ